ncbi:30S ribosomal protein S11 [Candidatus Uhrbacteria bacterium RIFCSPLOWO2_01_FULL_47_24]|uniref:Small ribosomal subunit protein uS11 n=1 Tax=Candidatus Uhrbacteria bacterium RIFCSPLOWO2_01_FULL_47_24 TaxID=1802401 RepID=A0A1F7UNV2_9BACT|nr:MAG: 30S ribosomal protein S11 [Candidatus Uhrbacteria bacterium RIFCSPHIGHO2_01_FULL_47_11]OGL68580.1 MAG: 30S ribosomal protein S11 [Candidatus Uhrbacteria bacterium RIFCSPHIGHO2_02_FULL_46_47]OGL79925.1 MAG: 30S ribosomal protein S11 [Candidatus Uhrbacteria bacterium RIFCSPLOWO2_01_FULL_47_24]OGL84786.1 MAG: 30S ribosomal protein S11 [Candidatus Uhrbacteria bacterium RIFCSPLOWO2_02_FULL_46_25]OGL93449.1 MAG: 30S ribosomal protein S11 [Candidatus Uhrbacteria bacterium RIFCSPLOWO2_12_FULL_4
MSEEITQEKITPVKKVTRTKEKLRRQVPRGRAYIQATYNNTIVTITDLNGDVLAWSSAGHMGFSGPKKATPYAAAQIVREVAQKAQPYGVREVYVFVNGLGSGRESAVRTLNAAGFQILAIKDITPIPHNGPRAPKPRRV